MRDYNKLVRDSLFYDDELTEEQVKKCKGYVKGYEQLDAVMGQLAGWKFVVSDELLYWTPEYAGDNFESSYITVGLSGQYHTPEYEIFIMIDNYETDAFYTTRSTYDIKPLLIAFGV